MTTYPQTARLAADPADTTESNARPAWLDETLFPFESHFVVVEGQRLHYIDEGQGPVILFLHGSPAWAFLYRDIIQNLRDSFRCIAVDFPGFGLSSVTPDYRHTMIGNSRLIEGFIESLQLHDVTLYLHDASAAMGLGVVVRQPGWFRGAVVSDSFAWPLDTYPSILNFIRVMASPIFGFMIQQFNFFARYFASNLRGGKLSEAEKRAYTGPFLKKANRRVQQEIFTAILGGHDYLVDLEIHLKQMTDFPILIAFGTGDAAYDAGWVTRYEALFPRHMTTTIQNGNHFPQEVDPQGIASAIRTWWSQVVSA